jgi:glycosyltransferase involved in cell wall biosynthesis
MYGNLIPLCIWLLKSKWGTQRNSKPTCHFIASRNYTIKSLENYTKDLDKYRIISDKIDFIFWITGDLDFEISGVRVKGKGKHLKNLKNFLVTQDPKKTILSCTDDFYNISVILLFKLFWGTKIIYYNLSLRRANEIMISPKNRSFKYKVASLITRTLYKFADIITFTRIMSHEVLYQSGETAFLKFVTADHTVRGTIQDLLDQKASFNNDAKGAKRSVALFTRFENMKRSEDAIDAYVNSIPYADKIPLLIYGGGSELDAAKSKYKNNDLLVFKGHIPQAEIVNRMMESLFILAPHSGGVSIEGGISERAVISYGCNAMPEYIIDNFTGILVDLNDTKFFTESINLLYSDQNLRTTLGLNGFQFNSQRFSKRALELSYAKLSDRLEKII